MADIKTRTRAAKSADETVSEKVAPKTDAEKREAGHVAAEKQARKDALVKKPKEQAPATRVPHRLPKSARPASNIENIAHQDKLAKKRIEARNDGHRKAEEQAYQDALVQPPEPKLLDGKKFAKGDVKPTLHELNMQARKLNRDSRDVALDAAKAAGQAALKVLQGSGKRAKSLASRTRNIRQIKGSIEKAMPPEQAAG